MSLQARRGTDLDVFLHSAIRLYDDGEKKVQHAPAALTLSTQIVHVCPAQVRQFVIDSQCIHFDILAGANAVLLGTWRTSKVQQVADSDRCCRSVAHQLEIANQMR